MYGTTVTYGTDHSNIFSEQVNNNCMVHSIMYRYMWISYPVYSTYNIGVFQVRCGIECDITYKVKIIVKQCKTLLYIIIGLSQPRRLSMEIVRVHRTNTEQLGNRVE
jgi:hypothetical protein